MVTLVFAGIMTATIVSGFTPLNLLFARLSQRRTDKGLRRRPGLAAPPRPGGLVHRPAALPEHRGG